MLLANGARHRVPAVSWVHSYRQGWLIRDRLTTRRPYATIWIRKSAFLDK